MSNQDNQKQAEQIEFVRSYALENYDKGWDEVIECWSNQDIAEVIKGARTNQGALRKMAAAMKYRISYRREIEATAF